MDISAILEQYQWLLSVYTILGVAAAVILWSFVSKLFTPLKETQELNNMTAEKRITSERYNAVQNRSKKSGVLTYLAVFVFIVPFVVTLDAQPVWEILLDIFVILMVYDFFYYLVHRFLFHDGPMGGPLQWVHAVHHQKKNPCRKDSNFLHPIETCMGIALFGLCFGGTALLMGDFHLITAVVTFYAFSSINSHNHDLMEVNVFPFKYLKYASDMHHVHHARFTAGNFATISLFWDWLFGTYDVGNGYKGQIGQQQSQPQKQA